MRAEMSDTVREFWGIIAAVVATIVWLVRLEARGVANAAEIRRIWAQRKEDMEAARQSRDKIDKRLDEIAADIKALLRGQGKP
jgi:hypothetical protein